MICLSIISNECTFSKFADDAQVRGAAYSLEGQEGLQCHLDRLLLLAVVNGMKFDKFKYQILHLGWSNVGHRYKLGEYFLENSPVERDLRVLVSSSSI